MSAATRSGSPRKLTQARREEYLEDHIPYRLQAIDGLTWYCEAILEGPGRLYGLVINLEGGRVPWTAATNALVDAGLTHGRAMMEFLGISRDKNGKLKRAERDPSRKRDDLWPSDFGLNDVSLKTALSSGPGRPVAVRAGLVRLHATASKGVAHLTIGSNPADVRRLHRATQTVRRLTEAHVYAALGIGLTAGRFDSGFRSPKKTELYPWEEWEKK